MEKLYNPISTYRIQLNKDFTLADLEKAIPYLHKLGIRTLYASPVFTAVPGSRHGYDGTDPNSLNPEIGTEDQLTRISMILKENSMGWMQDIVPNHMAFHENNHWLLDVLEKGPASVFAAYFDIDWNHPGFGERLMVPFPGSSLEKKLQAELPGAEHYMLCDWRETLRRINYRRFFTVNDLICLNIQHHDVFEHYHRLIDRCVRKGIFQGLRVDHVDGLADPAAYLEALRELTGPQAYISVEKILGSEEKLPRQWPVQGSTGYDFLAMVNNLLTNPDSGHAFTGFYATIDPLNKPASLQAQDKKAFVLYRYMAGELDNLTRLYEASSPAEAAQEEKEDLRRSIGDYLVRCPVYRYYPDDDDYPLMERDEPKSNDRRSTLKEFYHRCMQFTGPLMAKGVEDTLMYTYNRFIGHNEVGDSPATFGLSAARFHDRMQERLANWPDAMNATSTHDTKRGEDARARLNVLTDIHEEWFGLVKQWMDTHAELKNNGAPDDNDEYFIYQTLVATHPYPGEEPDGVEAYAVRLKAYLQKALREGKVHTDWSEPDSFYEEGTAAFASALLHPRTPFQQTFLPFLKKVADFGMINSIAQMVLKFTCPGIPDVYQGTELWDLSFVDPDNRRPVDFAARSALLNAAKPLPELWQSRRNGQIKLALMHQLLKTRNRYPEVFSRGEYIPVTVEGAYKNHVLAFIRQYKHSSILIAVPLHPAALPNMLAEDPCAMEWKDTRLVLPREASEAWTSLLEDARLDGLELPVGQLFSSVPVALLLS